MNDKQLIQYLHTRLQALQQHQQELNTRRNELVAHLTSATERQLWPQITDLSMSIWENRGKLAAYQEMLDYLGETPQAQPTESTDHHEEATPAADSASQAEQVTCPKCSADLSVTTTIETAPQPGHVTIYTHYDCPNCGHHTTEHVCLPREIALQRYNFTQLIRGL